jgi:pimeloyl-ACP methyl ester carboxylesterase
MKMLWTLISILVLWLVFAQIFFTFRSSDEAQRRAFEKAGIPLQTATFTIGNHHLHYAKTGGDDLPTLLFIHGSPGSWDAFSAYMKDMDLLQRFRMISVDRPGFGQSDFGKAEHLDKQSELIGRLVATLDNHHPVFAVGHSLGGPLVIRLASDHPGLFTRLVLIAASIDPAQEKPEKWRPLIFNTPLTYFVPGAMRPSNVELWYLKKDLSDLKSKYQLIRAPVCFIHGTKDSWVPPSNVDYGKRMLVNSPRVDTVMIEGANHFIPWTRFNEIKSVLLRLY